MNLDSFYGGLGGKTMILAQVVVFNTGMVAKFGHNGFWDIIQIPFYSYPLWS